MTPPPERYKVAALVGGVFGTTRGCGLTRKIDGWVRLGQSCIIELDRFAPGWPAVELVAGIHLRKVGYDVSWGCGSVFSGGGVAGLVLDE